MLSIFPDFWRHYPALLYAISAFLGAIFALESLSVFFLWLIAFLIMFSTIIDRKLALRTWLAIFFGLSSFLLTQVRYQFPENLPIIGGVAVVDIDGVSLSKSPFGSLWKYKGTLRSYIFEGQNIAKGIPVEIAVPMHKYNIRPLSGMKYELQGSLKMPPHGKYMLKPDYNIPWKSIRHLNSVAELRYFAKSALKKHLENSIKDEHVRAFLTGIVTGEFDDSQLSLELSRFGLQHLTAISGLHFSIFSAFLGFIFCLILPRPIAGILVIIFMTLYFIFLGESPSVTRAWVTIMIAAAALILCRQSSPLNSIGIALLIVILINPLAIYQIGFQFSFGVTFSILLWNGPCDDLLKKVFPDRFLSLAIKMTTLDQHGLLLLHYIRKALALSLSVNLVALPLTLFHFHKFPVMGLIYNLFIPALITLSLLLLLLAFMTEALFFPFARFLNEINEHYTKAVLNLGFHFPKSFDALAITAPKIPLELMTIYLACLFILGALFKHRKTLEPQFT